jgi:hypothetical protein
MRGEWGLGNKGPPPRQAPPANFKIIVNKNAIKLEIGGPPGNFPRKP